MFRAEEFIARVEAGGCMIKAFPRDDGGYEIMLSSPTARDYLQHIMKRRANEILFVLLHRQGMSPEIGVKH